MYARKLVRPRQLDQPLESRNRIAASAEVERDEVGLAARKDRDGRRLVLEMPAVVEFGQRRLDRPVAAVDDQHLRPDTGDDPHGVADLARFLDLVVEDVRVGIAIFADLRQLRDVSGRFGVGQQGNARAVLVRAGARALPDTARPPGSALPSMSALST